MGGSINVAFRFRDGEACCFDCWTNDVSFLSDLRILDEDETPAREYIANNSRNPVPVRVTYYGLVLIDYMTNTIIDANSYTSLFGDFHDFEIDNENRRGILVREALTLGREVVCKTYTPEHKRGDPPIITRISDLKDLPVADPGLPAGKRYRNDGFSIYDIDTSPWRYHCSMGETSAEKHAVQEILREINFPRVAALD